MNKENIQEVIKKTIQNAGHHPYLFVGSGFSKRYMGLENWEELLRKFCEEFSGDEFLYDSYANQIQDKDYYEKQPKIAALLEKDYNEAVFTQDKYKEFRIQHRELIQKGVSPFKVAIAKHFYTVDLDYENDEVKQLKEIAVRSISGIITTNYDLILEHIFSEYDVYIGQEEMLFANFTGMGEIYKIHGSANKPDSIIITEQDYQDFEKRSAYLIAKLLTMFLEYPVIFMGYSLQDKNIRNILKTISDCLSQEKIQLLKNRVIFVSYEEDNKVSERAITFENGNTITMQQISTTDFSLIYKAILSIKSRYSPRVLRDLRKDIYQLANTEHTKGVVYATGIENLDKIEEGQQFILGVGIQKNGRIIKAEQIYTDIVLDNQYFDPAYVIEEYLPELLKTNSGGLPMHKYLRDYSKELYERVKENFLKFKSVDDFLNQQLRSQKISYRKNLSEYSVAKIIELEGKEQAYKKLIFLEESEIDIKEMANYLEELMKEDAESVLKNNSELKRLIRIFDYIKYRKK